MSAGSAAVPVLDVAPGEQATGLVRPAGRDSGKGTEEHRARVAEGATVGLWQRQVVPRMVDVCCNTRETRRVRERVCAGLKGEVLEIGFGSGLNVRHYPASVTAVLAVEPSDTGWAMAAGRRAQSPVPVQRAGLDGQALPLPDGSVDAALSTWTLCTVPDPVAALREVRRVLRPGGRLHFVEHGLSPDAGVARWQRRLDPVQRRVAGGCHLSRPVSALLLAAGFALERLDVGYEKGTPRPFGYLYEGVAAPA